MGMAIEGKPVGRRVMLSMLGLGTAGVLVGAKVQDAISRLLAPVTAADPTGFTSLVPAAGRFRIYSVVGYLPSRKTTEYKLEVGGLVDKPATLSFADLVALPKTTLKKDFQCVTGWRVRDVDWVGVRLSDLLDAAGVKPSAKAVTFTSFDGSYTESLTLDQARRPDVMVAYSMEGKGIPSRHGGPVRLYVAPMYGYKSLKWLDTIEVVDTVEPGYWEVRGYDTDAWIGRSNGRDDQPV
jgi:DMSO/TMAO reductase YedYZ molybdopterin-dependent catalytic subunit